MKLLGSHTSPFVRKIRVVLIEKQIDCELVIDVMTGSPPPIEQYNPLGKIPALVLDDGLTLFDSQVITEYLDTLGPTPALIPSNPLERARVKRWEALADGVLDAGVSIVLEMRRPENERSPAGMDKQRGKMQRGLALMSEELGDREWFAGDHLSLAELAAGCTLLWLDFRFAELPWRTTHPNLDGLARRLAERRSFLDTPPNP